ncbi:MAG: DNA translocase FtsK 4TM domain-containing protein [Patescibacteria group bacterium]|nr:DNA translocase FtsK 4TM domain-containing protein [Patescibacteria group bacterium]
MARKKKKSQKKEKKQKEEKTDSFLKPEARHGIVVVVLFTVAVLSILSLFNVAGSFGGFIDTVLSYFFGWGKYFFPIILLVLGFLLLKPEKYIIRSINYLGLFFFILSYSGLLHIFLDLETAVERISEGAGGGYAGLLLSYPLQKIMGFWASLIVLLAAFIISLLLMFNTSLKNLSEKKNKLSSWFYRLNSFFSRFKKEKEVYDHPSFSKKKLKDEEDKEESEKESVSDESDDKEKDKTDKKEEEKEQGGLFKKKVKKYGQKIKIPTSLLENFSNRPKSGDIELNKTKIKKTLDNFGIEVEMAEVNVGPTVTQFTLKPTEGVKLSQITSLQNDIALALAAHPIRIEAPIPGKSLVGIEVPNQAVALVNLGDVIDTKDFKKSKSNLSFALGRDVSGKPVIPSLDPMPHLLIAGATGSGKSVCINSIILSLMYQNSPDDLKLILVDPKRVELNVYNDNPYLLTPVITDTKKTINALRWLVAEMEKRFQTLSKSGKRDIHVYHREVDDGMPFIVLIIDELADLMAVAASEVEAAIIRLAQMARAVGIHLVLATQRPSVNVLTGLIKANITARIAFNVASGVDSRTIIDMSGAEKLLGKGDMLFLSSELSQPKRLQGSHVSEKEVKKVVDFVKENIKEVDYKDEIVEKPQAAPLGSSMEDLGDDELLPQAQEVILRANKASASLLQRRLRIGYARAARILDSLEKKGIIGPQNGSKPREVLINKEDKTLSGEETVENSDENQEEENQEDFEEEEEEENGRI